ncbi:ABC-F family ATP-binding cassette domain-containing protein, partial [archaeon]
SKVNITTSTYEHKLHPNTRDIKVQKLTVILKGKELMADTDLNLNYGCRYGLIGPNGCGKSILMTILGRRMVPLPKNLDVYHLMSEIEPSDMTALEAVVAVDVERTRLQETAEALESLLTGEDNPEQDALNERLFEVYERLDELGADQSEMRASLILHGLGFTNETMAKKCRDFSGGWRMRIALARALFVHPTCLLLDEPTSHLDMEAVVWLERYLATYKGILLLVSHSQDFMNNVCTDIIRMYKKRLEYFGGNYDQYCVTRDEKEENQMKRYVRGRACVRVCARAHARVCTCSPTTHCLECACCARMQVREAAGRHCCHEGFRGALRSRHQEDGAAGAES